MSLVSLAEAVAPKGKPSSHPRCHPHGINTSYFSRSPCMRTVAPTAFFQLMFVCGSVASHGHAALTTSRTRSSSTHWHTGRGAEFGGCRGPLSVLLFFCFLFFPFLFFLLRLPLLSSLALLVPLATSKLAAGGYLALKRNEGPKRTPCTHAYDSWRPVGSF